MLMIHLVRADNHSGGSQGPAVLADVLAEAEAEVEVKEAMARGWPRGLVDGRH